MFVDVAKVSVQAGKGGDGVVSFRHEIYVDKGGPDGGDGGDGGDVVFVASRNQNTLANFRYHKEVKGEDGKSGGKRRQHGKSGNERNVEVPVGTVISDTDGRIFADLTSDGESAIVAKGGKGGFGNAHFVSSTRQAPKIAEKGEPGEQRELVLELKMIADVGLVGLPNAGKSTLLSTISNARPEIADYPFTTLRPNLGVVDMDKSNSLLFADIPGLIKGASKGKGLGDDFLRHVERTRVLIHMIDAYNDDIKNAYTTIQEELKSYKVDLSKLPQIVVITKVDGLDEEITNDLVSTVKKIVPKGTEVLAISSKTKQGINKMLELAQKISAKAATKDAKKKLKPIITLDDYEGWDVETGDERFIVRGKKIERFAARTDFNSTPGTQRLRDIMRKMGILHELEKKSIKPGQSIQIGDDPSHSIEY
jgi:GTP-binding protein